MLTATEIVFLKDIIEQLAVLADPSDYTQSEIDQALELIDTLEPIETEDYLKAMETLTIEEAISVMKDILDTSGQEAALKYITERYEGEPLPVEVSVWMQEAGLIKDGNTEFATDKADNPMDEELVVA